MAAPGPHRRDRPGQREPRLSRFQWEVERGEAPQGCLQARGRALVAAGREHAALSERGVRVGPVIARGLGQLGEHGDRPLRRANDNDETDASPLPPWKLARLRELEALSDAA